MISCICLYYGFALLFFIYMHIFIYYTFWFSIIICMFFYLYHCWKCASPHIYNQDVTTPFRWHSKSQTRRQVLWLCIIIIQRRQWGSTNSLKARSIWLQCETVLSSVTIIRIRAIPLESCPPRPSFFLIWPCQALISGGGSSEEQLGFFIKRVAFCRMKTTLVQSNVFDGCRIFQFFGDGGQRIFGIVKALKNSLGPNNKHPIFVQVVPLEGDNS